MFACGWSDAIVATASGSIDADTGDGSTQGGIVTTSLSTTSTPPTPDQTPSPTSTGAAISTSSSSTSESDPAQTETSAADTTTGTTSTSIDDEDGLVARFTFEDRWNSDGVTEDDLGNHDAVCDVDNDRCPAEVGGPDASRAAGFRPGRRLRIADDGSFDASQTGFTLAVWARLDADANIGTLMGKPVGSGPNNSWKLELSSGLEVSFTTATLSAQNDMFSFDPLPTETWIHLAGTYDGTTKRLYIDGQLVRERDVNVDFDDRDVLLGFDLGGAGNIIESYEGRLDDVRVYARPLDADEIAVLASTRQG